MKLTEKGFVFTDDNLHYQCRKYQDEAWFFGWNETAGKWEPLRKVSEDEVEAAEQRKIKVKRIDPLRV